MSSSAALPDPAPNSALPTAPPSPDPADRRRWFALAIVMTAAFMDLVDVTIVNIAIPSISNDLGASVSAIQWITA
ncbi:multidrug efflux MFS transporter, partial [Streptomyces sp. SID8455]|nr:multidrug efflux MFS transporter [Streptomyces sp. SID8455]